MNSFLNFSFLKNKPFYHKILVLLMVFMALYIIVPVVFIIFSIPFLGQNAVNNLQTEQMYSNVNWLKLMQIITQIGIFAGTAIVFARLNTKKTGDYLYLSNKSRPLMYVFGIIALLFSLPLVYIVMKLNQQIHLPETYSWLENSLRNQELKSDKMMEVFLNVSNIGGLVFNLFLIAIVPAICEELLFRGAIQRILLERTKNVHLSVIISSILFSAMHMQFFSFFPRLVLGLVLGYMVAYSLSLWTAIIAHAINNAISVITAYLFYNGQISSNYQDVGSTSNFFIIIFTSLISILFVILLHKQSIKYQKTS